MIGTRTAHTARAQDWLPLAVGAVVAAAVVALRGDGTTVLPLQVSAILLATGAGYALDDPAFDVLGPSPRSLLRRRIDRLAIVLPLVVAMGAALLAWQGTTGTEETVALTATFAGLVGLSVGIAGVAARRSTRGVAGPVVGPALFVLILLSTVVPPRWRPLPLGDIPGGWAQIYLRWTAAAVTGTVVLLLSSRDPAKKPWR